MDISLQHLCLVGYALTLEHVQYFTYQLFNALDFLHKSGIIHGNLRPASILIATDCSLKLREFGLGHFVAYHSPELWLDPPEVSRYWRAPEEILFSSAAPLRDWYTPAIDLWSAGMIVAQMFNRPGTRLTPLITSSNDMDYMRDILRLVGRLSEAELAKIPPSKARDAFVSMLAFWVPADATPTNWKQLLHIPVDNSEIPDEAAQFLSSLLVFDWTRRISAKSALCHPFLAEIHDEDEWKLQVQPTLFVDHFEQQLLNAKQHFAAPDSGGGKLIDAQIFELLTSL